MADELDAADGCNPSAREDTPSASSARSDGVVPNAQLGRFVLLRALGTGGMGVVYEAYDTAARCNVALKTLRRGGGDPRALKREFRAAAALSHPNLVVLHELYADDADVYFTMELVHGVDLLQFLRRGAPAPDELVSTCLISVFHLFISVARGDKLSIESV